MKGGIFWAAPRRRCLKIAIGLLKWKADVPLGCTSEKV